MDENGNAIEDGYLVQGCIGAMPRLPSFKKILKTSFHLNTFKLSEALIGTTGSVAIASVYTNKEMLEEVGVVGTFSVIHRRPCLYKTEELLKLKNESNAQNFYMVSHKGMQTIMVPCKLETEQYFDLYIFLGRTYFEGKGPFE